jgi:hypothetical protein
MRLLKSAGATLTHGVSARDKIAKAGGTAELVQQAATH